MSRVNGKLPLSPFKMRRYSRHLTLPEIGIKAQSLICKFSVLVVGAGGLGVSVLQSLCAAGMGRIGIVDDDRVSISNLHRQILYDEVKENRFKVDCAKERLEKQNSSVVIETFKTRLTSENAEILLKNYSLIADCTDNIDSRYVINDFSTALGKPVVSAAAIGVEGQLNIYGLEGGPCLRCMFPQKSPQNCSRSCDSAGVFGIVPNIMGTLQALEILKIAGNFGEHLNSKFLHFDSIKTKFTTLKIGRKKCYICKSKEEGFSEQKLIEFVQRLHLEEKRKENEYKRKENEKIYNISCEELKKKISSSACNGKKELILIDVRPQYQFLFSHLEGAKNIPLAQIESNPSQSLKVIEKVSADKLSDKKDVFVICMKGISSLKVCKIFQENSKNDFKFYNVTGGLTTWKEKVEKDFPLY